MTAELNMENARAPEPIAARGDEMRTQASATTPALPEDALILVPTRNLVLFPGLVTPLAIGREASTAAVQEAMRLKRRIGVILQRDADIEQPTASDLHSVGTAAAIL